MTYLASRHLAAWLATIRFVVRGVVCLWLCVACTGCAVFQAPALTGTTTPLPWLTAFGAPATEAYAAPFDLSLLQPPPRAGVAAGELLEVTVWDLVEPGQPATFPVRVSTQGEIDLPYIRTVGVSGHGVARIEQLVASAYQTGEWLQQPRVLVREQPGTSVRVFVTGAVTRPGVAELTPRDASVFAALVACGGLTRDAGRHLFVSGNGETKIAEATSTETTERTDSHDLGPQNGHHNADPTGNAGPQMSIPPWRSSSSNKPVALGEKKQTSRRVTSETESLPSDNSEDPFLAGEQSEPTIRANHTTAISIPADQPTVHSEPPQEIQSAGTQQQSEPATQTAPTASSDITPDSQPEPPAAGSDLETRIATRPDFPQPKQAPGATPNGHWYDLTREEDLQALRSLVLSEGTMITVKPAVPPVRITGAVRLPGSYPLPAGHGIPLAELLQSAGGLTTPDAPIVIGLVRPATSDRAGQRWTIRLKPRETPPAHLPLIRAGDQLHIEPTTKAKVQHAIDGLWPTR